MAIPVLEDCDIAGKDVTADALLTQRALAIWLVEQQAHYHFTVKGNQLTLEHDIAVQFEHCGPSTSWRSRLRVTVASKPAGTGAVHPSMVTSISHMSARPSG
jgi:hypothetical protein